jgi:hypothetical protein
VGESFSWDTSRNDFMVALTDAFKTLRAEVPPLRWL